MSIKENSIQSGFSLIEVVVAVGIFALAIVGVIGLLAPTARNVSDVADSDAATRVVSAIQTALQQQVSSSSTGFAQLGTTLQVPASGVSPTYDYYASKDGRLVGKAADIAATDRFFEFSLLRNTSLSGTDNSGDATAGFLAFTISLRWPAYLPNGQVADNSQKSVMIVPAAVTR